MLHIEAFHNLIKISTIIITSSMHEHNFNDMHVSRCELNIAISLEDVDFNANGCMFIELGMNQRCTAKTTWLK